jgi:hypothetical protein
MLWSGFVTHHRTIHKRRADNTSWKDIISPIDRVQEVFKRWSPLALGS